jgi:hypothetical protein
MGGNTSVQYIAGTILFLENSPNLGKNPPENPGSDSNNRVSFPNGAGPREAKREATPSPRLIPIGCQRNGLRQIETEGQGWPQAEAP